MRGLKILMLGAFAGVLSASAAHAVDGPISAADMKKLVPGRYAVTVAPGVIVNATLSSGGAISGVTNKGDRDTGRWRFSGSQMCVTFKKWLDHQPHCSGLSYANGQIKGDGFYAKWQ